jgi:hypothetical protein
MRASGDALLLHAEAADGAALEFIENLIGSHLGRFSRREPLTVTGTRPARPPPGKAVRSRGTAIRPRCVCNQTPGRTPLSGVRETMAAGGPG